MRIAILSDIHGNLPALEAVAADMARRGVDRVVNLGDSLSGPLLPRETAHFLMAAAWPSLAGNHERQLLDQRPDCRGASDEYALSQLTSAELTWLRSLNPAMQLTEEIFLCHGTPASDCDYFLDTALPGGTRLATPDEIEARLAGQASSVVACGHTHLPRAIRTQANQLLINPGSVGLPAYEAKHPIGHVVQTGSPDARYAIVEKQPDGWTALLLAVPYDHHSMARLAQARHRPDWAAALETGYVR